MLGDVCMSCATDRIYLCMVGCTQVFYGMVFWFCVCKNGDAGCPAHHQQQDANGGSSSEGYDEMEDKLYADRDDWADVTPVPQDDGANPACPIAYTAECQSALSTCPQYF